jgi:hypothetical protein
MTHHPKWSTSSLVTHLEAYITILRICPLLHEVVGSPLNVDLIFEEVLTLHFMDMIVGMF